MSGDHYFSASPASAARPREIEVRIDPRSADAPLRLTTDAGVFSPDRLDAGTEVLLKTVLAPPPSGDQLVGDVLDLGCGWGPIAIALGRRAPDATVWAVDVNERALALTAANAARAGVEVTTAYPNDIPASVRFTTIWSNPPIRVGKAVLHEMLETWIPRLTPGGSAWLVVARHLGADSLERWLRDRFGDEGFAVRRAGIDRGYRVLEVTRVAVTASGTSTTPE